MQYIQISSSIQIHTHATHRIFSGYFIKITRSQKFETNDTIMTTINANMSKPSRTWQDSEFCESPSNDSIPLSTFNDGPDFTIIVVLQVVDMKNSLRQNCVPERQNKKFLLFFKLQGFGVTSIGCGGVVERMEECTGK